MTEGDPAFMPDHAPGAGSVPENLARTPAKCGHFGYVSKIQRVVRSIGSHIGVAANRRSRAARPSAARQPCAGVDMSR